MTGKHIFVHGKVQGVGLRFHTHEKARELGLKGWVRNLEDGRVEIVAFGETEALELLLAWLPGATPSTRVSQIEEIDVDREFQREIFSIRRDGGPTWPTE